MGEIWAYRARGVDPLTPVRVVRHGQRKPARVLIRHEDEAMEALEEWVPPARLKVPWGRVEDLIASEARWAAVNDLGPDRETAETRAAEAVFDVLVDEAVAVLDYRSYFLSVSDVRALADLSGLPTEELTAHLVSFESDGDVVVPWPVALRAAEELARRMPDQVLAQVESEERNFQDRLIHGLGWNRGDPYRDVEGEAAIVREVDEGGARQSRDLRRQWAGTGAVGRWDELVELRREIHRVGQVAEEAIATLRRRGHKADAARLEAALGQTVEMIRPDSD